MTSDRARKGDSADDFAVTKRKPPILPLLVISVALVAFVLIMQAMEASIPAMADGAAPAGVMINEAMSSNSAFIADEEGDFSDWCELYNPTDSPVRLQNFALTDDPGNPIKWLFPDVTIEPKAYLTIWLSGKDRKQPDAPIHTSFKLGSDETLQLLDASGRQLDSLTMAACPTDHSYGRDPVNPAELVQFAHATPGFPNTEDGYTAFKESITSYVRDIRITEICAKNRLLVPDEDGEYQDWIELYNTGSQPIDLFGYGLSDKLEKPMKWIFPHMQIDPGQYLLIYASGKDKYTAGNSPHTNFSLGSGGETLVLSNPRALMVDTVTFSELPDDASYALQMDTNEWSVQMQPTPGLPNTTEGALTLQRQMYANNPGLYLMECRTSAKRDQPEDDWIELLNASPNDIQLRHYALSTDPGRPALWRFPEKVLGSGERIVVYANSLNEMREGKISANFNLSKEGEILLLTQVGDAEVIETKRIVDVMPIPALPPELTFGRSDGQDGFFYYTVPTPGAPNGEGVREVSPQPTVDVAGGLFAQPVQVTASCVQPDVPIHYTTDGSVPTAESPVASGAITVDKTTVLRFRTLKEGMLPSRVTSESYVVGENHTLAVVSLVCEPGDLFDYHTGIYADGPGKEGDPEPPYSNANYWKDWERPVNVSVYLPDGTQLLAPQDAGIKIFGQYSRDLAQKSFRLVARNDYGGGDVFAAPLFPNRPYTEYKNFVLRNTAQNYYRGRPRDELITSLLAGNEDANYQDYRACVVYINGQYWGQYYMRERIDQHSIAQWEDYKNPENIDLIKGNSILLNGSSAEYKELTAYIKEHDLSVPENLRYVTDRIDVDSLFTWAIWQIYFYNTDNGNIKFYRANTVEGAKWRWVSYDFDWSINSSADENNGFERIFHPEGMGVGHMFNNTHLRKLIAVPEMRDRFLELMVYHMENTFQGEVLVQKLDALSAEIAPELPRHYERWSDMSANLGREQKNLEDMRKFLRERNGVVRGQMQRYFGLSDSRMEALFQSGGSR